MMSWISKYRLSAALDEKTTRRPVRPESLDGFATELAAVDELLKNHSAGVSSRPVYFHGSIMRAVRAAAVPARPSRRLRWAPALGLAGIAAAGLLWALSVKTPAPAAPTILDSASSALVLGNTLARDASGIAQPMSDELERVNRDIERAADFLLSSMP